MTLNPGIIITEILTRPNDHGLGKPLFAREIFEKLCDLLTARHCGQKMNNQIEIEIERTIREVFLRQAELRGVSSFGIEKLASRVRIEVDATTSNITLHITPELTEEIDRYLYNKHCRVCSAEIPGGSQHTQEECDNYLVEDLMNE